jgi:hypothetical protein
MPYMLTAQNDSTSVIGDRHDPLSRIRIILGRGYTNSEAAVSFATRAGYDVTEVAQIPPAYLEQVARIDALQIEPSFSQDGADPEAKYMFTGKDGHTHIDIRDVISGALTA